MSATALTVFNGNGDQSVVTTTKSGRVNTTYFDKKTYGLKHGLKGAALNRAHYQYRLDRGLVANTNTAAAIASGKIVIEKHSLRADGKGGTLGYMFIDAIKAPSAGRAAKAVSPMEAANTLTTEQLMAILEARTAPATAPATV